MTVTREVGTGKAFGTYELAIDDTGDNPTEQQDYVGKVAEPLASFNPDIPNANAVVLRFTVDPAVRHDGETETGLIIDGGAGTTIVTTNDVIIEDLLFKVTVNNRNFVYAEAAGATNCTIRRCVGLCDVAAGQGCNIGFGIAQSGSSIWFCHVIRVTGFNQKSLRCITNANSCMFNAVHVVSGVHSSVKGPNLSGAGRAHGNMSLQADGGSANEYTGSKSTSQSFNLGEGEVPPGTDPIDLTDDLGIGFTDVFNSTDGSDWGIKQSFVELSGVAYTANGGRDVGGDAGFEAIDLYGNPFDPADMVVGPRQKALVVVAARRGRRDRDRG